MARSDERAGTPHPPQCAHWAKRSGGHLPLKEKARAAEGVGPYRDGGGGRAFMRRQGRRILPIDGKGRMG